MTQMYCISISDIIVKSLTGEMWCLILALLLSYAVSQSEMVEFQWENWSILWRKQLQFIWNLHTYSLCDYKTHALRCLCFCACASCLLSIGLFSTPQRGKIQYVNKVSLLFSNKSIEREAREWGERERVRHSKRERESECPGCLTWLGYVNKISVVKAAAANNREHCLMSNGMYRETVAVCECVCILNDLHACSTFDS